MAAAGVLQWQRDGRHDQIPPRSSHLVPGPISTGGPAGSYACGITDELVAGIHALQPQCRVIDAGGNAACCRTTRGCRGYTRSVSTAPGLEVGARGAALLRGPGDDPEPDPRVVAAGLLSLLNESARRTPVRVAIDDLQWLDDSSGNQRHAARTTLEEADRLFDEVGCASGPAPRAERDRLGLRPAAGDELTPTEQRIAELAGSGQTVREVNRIYRKLGICTHVELGRLMAQHSQPALGDDAPASRPAG